MPQLLPTPDKTGLSPDLKAIAKLEAAIAQYRAARYDDEHRDAIAEIASTASDAVAVLIDWHGGDNGYVPDDAFVDSVRRGFLDLLERQEASRAQPNPGASIYDMQIAGVGPYDRRP